MSEWGVAYASLLAVAGDVLVESALVGHLGGLRDSADRLLPAQPGGLR